ncbi:hypothetical protein AVEN_35918-1 [Araneus ventricosus]|uniref:Uncharacterized protein n=1 Tax=Araneus ventricosus TaxID=182803 RepID=A0A4Y2R181_ARAVE|nr:hypothetical protein AVEN_35918-1 [Araneus ventricosus]
MVSTFLNKLTSVDKVTTCAISNASILDKLRITKMQNDVFKRAKLMIADISGRVANPPFVHIHHCEFGHGEKLSATGSSRKLTEKELPTNAGKIHKEVLNKIAKKYELCKTNDLKRTHATVGDRSISQSALALGLIFPPWFYHTIVFNGVVCSVCLVNAQTVYTFYGQQDCPESGGWELQYAGYAMVSETMKYETVCVDSKLEAHQDSYVGLHDQNLKFVLAKHPDKKNVNVFLPCVVCSK